MPSLVLLHLSQRSACSYLFRDDRLVARSEVAQRCYTPELGRCEHAAVESWARAHKAIRALRELGQVRRGEIAAIGLVTLPGVVAWSRAGDRPLCPAPVGPDARRAAWLLTHAPAVRAAAEKDDLMLGPIDAWLVWNLTGRFATAPDNAAATGLLDPRSQAWDAARCAALGLPLTALPEITRHSAAWGSTCEEGPFNAVAPILAVRAESPNAPAWDDILACRDALTLVLASGDQGKP